MNPQPSSVSIYDSNTIDTLPWPRTREGEYARKFLEPFVKEGPQVYVPNAKTKMFALKVDEIVLPITVNESEHENCYLCSPVAQYVDYSKEKLDLNNPFIRLWHAFLRKLLVFGKAGKIVQVNNWLLSTNLYPKLSPSQVNAIASFLKKTFPTHTIIFRSINEKQDPELTQSLLNIHSLLIASRPIFITNAREDYAFQSRMFKSDLKVLKGTDYQILENDEIPLSAAQRIAELYGMLNISKYSTLNPILSPKFIELALKENLLCFKVLRKNDTIDAVMGYFTREEVITSPLFGYDTTKPHELGLYRKIATLLALDAREQELTLNHSGGAGSFKKLRRAEGIVEYHAVICDHLPQRQRFPWKFLKFIMDKWGVPYIKKHEL